MKFRDIKHFHEVIDLYHDDLASLEKTYGYTSYNTKIDQVIDALDLISNKSEFRTFMKENQNYMTTRLRDGEESYERIINPNTHTSIANKNGLYYIGDTAYRIIGEYILSSEIKMVNQLLSVNYDDLIKNQDKPNNVKKYINCQTIELNNTLKATTTYLGGDLSAWAQKGDDRKVFLFATAAAVDFQGGFDYYVRLEGRGEKKSWLLGWIRYNTTIHITGTDPAPIPPMAGTDIIFETPYWGRYSYAIGYSSYYGKSYMLGLFSALYYTDDNYGLPIYFTRAKVKAMTSGTDPIWAIIDEEE